MDKKFKKLSKGRSVTIPRDMAAHLDLSPGTSVDMTAAGDGSLIIRKHTDTCRFCGGVEKVKPFEGIFVCPLCAARIYQEVCGDE